MWIVPALEVTDVARAELERRVRAKTASPREARRARTVLLAADDVPNRRIATEAAMSEEYVGLWRRRFAEKTPGGPEGPQALGTAISMSFSSGAGPSLRMSRSCSGRGS
jgi:hypothetical protein